MIFYFFFMSEEEVQVRKKRTFFDFWRVRKNCETKFYCLKKFCSSWIQFTWMNQNVHGENKFKNTTTNFWITVQIALASNAHALLVWNFFSLSNVWLFMELASSKKLPKTKIMMSNVMFICVIGDVLWRTCKWTFLIPSIVLLGNQFSLKIYVQSTMLSIVPIIVQVGKNDRKHCALHNAHIFVYIFKRIKQFLNLS